MIETSQKSSKYVAFIFLFSLADFLAMAQGVIGEEAQKSRENLQFYVKTLSPVVFTVLLLLALWLFYRKRKNRE